MNNKFDELARSMAQTVGRRQALKKFGVGLAGMALASFGLANRAQADPKKTCGRKGHFCGFGYLPCCPGLSCGGFTINGPICT